MKSQGQKTRDFYNEYGEREWERLEKTSYDHLNFLLHMDFINGSLDSNLSVCDVGCGAGRFSIEFAKAGCKLTLVDISDKQLELAKEKLVERNLDSNLEQVINSSLDNLHMIEDESYDITVCYGAPINYLHDKYVEGIKELYRITKFGGKIFVSVNSKLGVMRSLYGNKDFDMTDFLEKHEYWFVDQVVDSGDLPEHPEVEHPARHFFGASELRRIFTEAGFKDIQLGSSPCLVTGLRDRVEEISKNSTAWETMLRQELKVYMNEDLADVGEFLMIKASK